MVDPITAHAVGGAVSGLASVISGVYDHPREEYLEKVKQVQKDRLDDVCDQLGPVVAIAARAVQNDEGEDSPEDLTEEDKAAFFMRQGITQYDDFDKLQQSLGDFHEPKELYRNARRQYEWGFKLFISSFALVALSAFLNLAMEIETEMLLNLAAVTFVIGSLAVSQYIFTYRKKLNEMCDENEFEW